MYGGYTAAALALRAKSSISYDCVPSSSSYYSTELALNPRLLLYNGYLLRQSSLLYWSPSRSLLAGRSRLWPTWSAKESWRWRRCPSLSVEIKCCDCDRTRCERSCLGANFGEFEQSSSYLEEKGRRVCDCDRFRSERSKLEADRGEFRRTRSKLEENRSGSCSACGSELSRASRDGRGRVVRREVREIWEYDDEKDAAFRVSDRRGREDYDYKDDYKVVKRRDGRERESRLRNNVDARKKKKVDQRVVRRSEDSEEEAELLIDSAREGGEEYDYEEQNVVGRRYSEEDSQFGRRYSEEDSRRSRRASERNVGREENLSSRVKRQSNVGRREAERRFDLAHAERDDFAHEEEQLVRRESRERSRKDTRASQVQEDDRNWASSSKRVNFTSSNQKIAGRNEEKKSTQKIKEISEVHDGNVERASHFERLYEEMRAKNREDTSSSVQNYVQMRGDKRRVIDQEVVDEKEVNISKSKIDVTKVDSQVNKGSALKHNQTESRRSSQNLTEISLAKNSNIESVSNSQNHYEGTRAKERESSSTSVQNSFQVTGDRRSQINQQVIDNSQLNMQNITRTDVSSSNKSDTMIVKSSQNILDTKIDNRVFSTTVVNIGHEQMGQQEYLRTDAERNSQVSGFGRSNTERWDNSQEVCNRRIEDERAKRQYSLRGESERDSNVSHYLSDAERVSDYKEMSDSRRENRRGSTLVMVEEQEAKGGTRQQLKAKMTFTGSSGTSSSSRQTDEFDSRAKRDETHLVRNDALESATQLERSSASYVGEFVDKLQQEMSTSDGKDYSSEGRSETQIGGLHRRTSQAATAAQSSTLDAMTTHRDDNYMEEGAKRSSRSGVKGPSDEMWDVKSATSQETFRSSDREEASSPTGAADLTTLTGTETVHARRSSKSLWNYVADIVKLGWISRSESRDSAKKSGKRSSSNDSVGSEGWFSGQEQGEDDETSRKGDTTTPQEPVLIKRPIEQSYPSTPAGPSQGSSVVPRMRGKVTISEASTTASVDIINEGFLAPSASSVFSPEHVQRIESENPIAQSSVVTIDQSSIVKDDKSSPTIAEISGSANVQVPLGSYVKQTEIPGSGNVQVPSRSYVKQTELSSSANVQVPLGSYVKQTEIPGSGNVQVPSGSYVKQTELSSGANVQVPLGSYVKQTEIPGSGNVQVPSGSYVKQTELSSGANVQVPLGSYVKQTEISGSPNVQVPSSSYVKQTEISGSANVQVPSSSYVKQTELSISANPLGSYVKQTENPIIEEPPELVRIEGTDAELKRRKFQRNKQVLRESFDGWEEAYKRESEQRKLDEFFMREALEEAQRAADTWEVPVGAVLVRNGEIVARGCNLVEELRDSTAHAEMICIREASNHLRTWRLAETTLYVTLEPCAMCAGAILQARIDTVVWGAPNKLLGADGSWVKLFPGDGENSNADLSSQTAGPVHPFHSKIRIRRGVLATECSEIMQQFFQLRRKKKKQPEPLPPPPPPPPPRFSVSSHPIKFFTKLPGFFSVFCL